MAEDSGPSWSRFTGKNKRSSSTSSAAAFLTVNASGQGAFNKAVQERWFPDDAAEYYIEFWTDTESGRLAFRVFNEEVHDQLYKASDNGGLSIHNVLQEYGIYLDILDKERFETSKRLVVLHDSTADVPTPDEYIDETAFDGDTYTVSPESGLLVVDMAPIYPYPERDNLNRGNESRSLASALISLVEDGGLSPRDYERIQYEYGFFDFPEQDPLEIHIRELLRDTDKRGDAVLALQREISDWGETADGLPDDESTDEE